METIQVAVAILTVMTCLLGLVAVSTDYWLVNEDDTQSAGLFNSCVGVSCIKSIESKEEHTSAFDPKCVTHDICMRLNSE